MDTKENQEFYVLAQGDYLYPLTAAKTEEGSWELMLEGMSIIKRKYLEESGYKAIKVKLTKV